MQRLDSLPQDCFGPNLFLMSNNCTQRAIRFPKRKVFTTTSSFVCWVCISDPGANSPISQDEGMGPDRSGTLPHTHLQHPPAHGRREKRERAAQNFFRRNRWAARDFSANSPHTFLHDVQQALSHVWEWRLTTAYHAITVRLNDLSFLSKLYPATPPCSSPPPHFHLQFENRKSYKIHHRTMMPKEQKKYHLSFQHQSDFENISTFLQYSVPKKKFWRMV